MLNTKELEAIVDFLESNFDLDDCELPDEYYYTCFPLCLLDAVFSIGVRYSSTRNAVQNYCSKYAVWKRKLTEARSSYYTISQ